MISSKRGFEIVLLTHNVNSFNDMYPEDSQTMGVFWFTIDKIIIPYYNVIREGSDEYDYIRKIK